MFCVKLLILGNAQIARMIEEHFTLPNSGCGEKGFKDVLYLSQVKTQSCMNHYQIPFIKSYLLSFLDEKC